MPTAGERDPCLAHPFVGARGFMPSGKAFQPCEQLRWLTRVGGSEIRPRKTSVAFALPAFSCFAERPVGRDQSAEWRQGIRSRRKVSGALGDIGSEATA